MNKTHGPWGMGCVHFMSSAHQPMSFSYAWRLHSQGFNLSPNVNFVYFG